jgi:hypothetical protein
VTVCHRAGTESRVQFWACIRDALDAAQICPCGPGFLGIHEVAIAENGAWHVTAVGLRHLHLHDN